MKTTAIDIHTGAVRDDVEAEKGYNHEVDVEEYQRYLAIQEASMGDYQSDAETLVVESRPRASDATRQRGQELLNEVEAALIEGERWYHDCVGFAPVLPVFDRARKAMLELSEISKQRYEALERAEAATEESRYYAERTTSAIVQRDEALKKLEAAEKAHGNSIITMRRQVDEALKERDRVYDRAVLSEQMAQAEAEVRRGVEWQVLQKSERIAELEAQLAEWKKTADHSSGLILTLRKERDQLRRTLDTADAKEKP